MGEGQVKGVLSFHARWIEELNPFVEVKNMRIEIKHEMEDSTDEFGVLQQSSPSYRYVVGIKDEYEMELVGGKAFNISRLARKGFRVPEGFCITTRAYDYFMDFNNILGEDREISNKIREGVMPLPLAEIICNAYHMYLKSRSCAVRSSSPHEDLKNASFAGQYKSFLNVEGENALLEAVKECWASLWSPSAIEYRKKMEIGDEDIEMAILIQEMCLSKASGVLFTEEKMVIEAVWGLGDILVGGEVTPDHFEVERNGFKVVERRLSHKNVMSQAGPNGGVEVVDVPENAQDAPVLGDSHLYELCALGKKVEDLFGCPQDIEWALCDGEFVFLQARPISVKQTKTVWSRVNVGEMQPGYVTYLSRTPENRPDFLMLSAIPLLECFGIKDIPENTKFMDYIYGHIYANISNTYSIICKIPGISPELMDQCVGTPSEEGTSESKLELSALMKMLPGSLKAIRFFLSLPAQAEESISSSLELIEDIRHRNLRTMTLEELDNLVWEMDRKNVHVLQIRASTIIAAMSLFGIIKKLLNNSEETEKANSLVLGLEGMSSCELAAAMWQLAQGASKSPEVTKLILSRRKDALEELEQLPEGREFLKGLGDFLERFGDRCSQELELSAPRWEEDLHYLFNMMATYLTTPGSNPVETMENQKQIRLEATNCILRKLSRNPVEKLVFRKLLEKTQQYIVTRENLKTAWVRGISATRTVYLTIAEKMVDKGILESRDDIFYLKMTEVSDIITSNLGKEQFYDHIKERRIERKECEHLDVPMEIIGEPPPIEELKYTVESKAQIQGIGCSPGVITGKARVVFDPSECLGLGKDEILVAPVTNPGWSPLFVTAGGLVMEMGGALSHGAIIAREYGIPVVVGVENATKIIKTGQLITIDGSRGIVYVKERELLVT